MSKGHKSQGANRKLGQIKKMETFQKNIKKLDLGQFRIICVKSCLGLVRAGSGICICIYLNLYRCTFQRRRKKVVKLNRNLYCGMWGAVRVRAGGKQGNSACRNNTPICNDSIYPNKQGYKIHQYEMMTEMYTLEYESKIKYEDG